MRTVTTRAITAVLSVLLMMMFASLALDAYDHEVERLSDRTDTEPGRN